MKTILLADNKKSETTKQRELLTKYGYSVVGEAEDVEQTVEMFIKWNPYLTIIRLHRLDSACGHKFDGIQAANGIRKIDNNALFVMTTDTGSHPIIIEAIRCGTKDFIMLPMYPQRLIETVVKLIGKP